MDNQEIVILREPNVTYDYDRIPDESVYSVCITRDQKPFADILFLNYYLSRDELFERGILSLAAQIIPIPAKGPKFEEYKSMRVHLALDQFNDHLSYMTHFFCRELTSSLNGPQLSDVYPQRKWTFYSVDKYPNVIRIERDMGASNLHSGLEHSAFADVSFVNPADKENVQNILPAILGRMCKYEEDLLIELGLENIWQELQKPHEDRKGPKARSSSKRKRLASIPFPS